MDRGRRLVACSLALSAILLSSCTQPVQVGLVKQTDGEVVALIDPCRPDFDKWTSVVVVDGNGNVLWQVAAPDGMPRDVRRLSYGVPPPGMVARRAALPFPTSGTVQFRYSGPAHEPILQTFTVSRLSASEVLRADDSRESTKKWEACD